MTWNKIETAIKRKTILENNSYEKSDFETLSTKLFVMKNLIVSETTTRIGNIKNPDFLNDFMDSEEPELQLIKLIIN